MDTLHQTPFGSFEWDSRKNDANIEKHGLDFVDVVLVFQDSYARIEYDPKHSEGEERYRITAVSYTHLDVYKRQDWASLPAWMMPPRR